MRIIDFLMYCNVIWTRKYSKTETTKEYAGSFAAISITIGFMVWIATILRIFVFLKHHEQLSATPLLIIDLLAVLVFIVLRYIYIKKGRLKLILDKNEVTWKIADKAAVRFIFITNFASILIFILVPIILNIIK